jgi:hypothetical protein
MSGGILVLMEKISNSTEELEPGPVEVPYPATEVPGLLALQQMEGRLN